MAFLKEQISNIVARHGKNIGAPGYAVCVLDARGNVLVDQADILHDMVDKAPLGEGSLFPLGSVSKTFTAALAMLLDEESILDLDKPITGYLPGLEKIPELHGVTLHQLLKHAGKLQWQNRCYDEWTENPETYPSSEDIGNSNYLLEHLNLEALRTPVDTDQAGPYSNASYALAARVMEAAYEMKTGKKQSFAELCNVFLLEPCNLNNIRAGLSVEEIKNLQTDKQIPTLYVDDAGGRLKPFTFPHALKGCTSSGGFYGTARDVAKFFHFLMMGDIVKEPSLVAMRAYQKEDFPWGAGLCKLRCGDEGHTGELWGAYSRVCFMPDTQLTIVVLENYRDFGSAQRYQHSDVIIAIAKEINETIKNLNLQCSSPQRQDASLAEVAGEILRTSEQSPNLPDGLTNPTAKPHKALTPDP